LPEPYVQAMLKGIVGVELAVARLEGKFKLSQNRPAGDRPRIISALDARGDPESAAAVALMREREPAPLSLTCQRPSLRHGTQWMIEYAGDHQALFRNASDLGSSNRIRSEARELRTQARQGEVHEGADFGATSVRSATGQQVHARRPGRIAAASRHRTRGLRDVGTRRSAARRWPD
jgi:hypothetical protein